MNFNKSYAIYKPTASAFEAYVPCIPEKGYTNHDQLIFLNVIARGTKIQNGPIVNFNVILLNEFAILK